MSSKTIQATKNYRLFTNSAENRPLDPKKHKQLLESMKLFRPRDFGRLWNGVRRLHRSAQLGVVTMPALSPPDRLPVTPAGLVVIADGARWCTCLCRAHRGWILAERTADGLVARWRFRRKRAAEERRAELVRG